MRAIIIYISLLISSLGTSQVDSLSLLNIPTKKCTISKFPVKWNSLDYTPPQSKVKSTLTDIVPKRYEGLKTKYLGQAIFEKIIPESIVTKKLNKTQTKDVATLEINYFDKRHGLPGNTVYTVGKNAKGHITFGTGNYLNSYDGLEMTSYLFNDTIGEIRHLSSEHSSRMWVSTTSGVYFQEADSFYALKNTWGTSFWTAVMDHQGTLWMSSYNEGVFYIKNDSLFQLTNDEIQVDTKEVLVDSKDQIWMVCRPGVIRISKQDTVIFRLSSIERQPSSIKEFNGKIYVGVFLNGLRAIEGDQVWNIDLGAGVRKRHVSDLEVSPSGLWFTPFGLGIRLLKADGRIYSFTDKEGFPGNSSHKITADDFGNVWVAGFLDGLSVFREANLLPNLAFPKSMGVMQTEEIANSDTSWIMYYYDPPIRKVGDQFYQLDKASSATKHLFFKGGEFEHGDKVWIWKNENGFAKYERNAIHVYDYMISMQSKSPKTPYQQYQDSPANTRTIPDPFGLGLEPNATHAIIGAPDHDLAVSAGSKIINAGSAIIYEPDSAGQWIKSHELQSSDPQANDLFGWSTATEGNYAVVGAPHEDHDAFGGAAASSAGSAYLFKKQPNGTWQQQQKIVASDRVANMQFGQSVSISERFLIIGANCSAQSIDGSQADATQGAAYIFEQDADGNWKEVQKIMANDGEAGDRFGNLVSIGDHQAIVGTRKSQSAAHGENDLSDVDAMYVFNRNNNGQWSQTQKILNPRQTLHLLEKLY